MILAVETGKLLSYSHWSPMGGTDDAPGNYHVVEIALADAGEATTVTVTQSNLTGAWPALTGTAWRR